MYKLTEITIALLALAGSGLACNGVDKVKLTNYGWPTANQATSYKCNGGTPGQPGGKTILGDGSFQKPYAAAAAKGSKTFPQCSMIYVPLLKKYFKIQDDCANCRNTKPDQRVDLYTFQVNKDIGQLQCLQNFGTFDYNGNKEVYENEVIVNPGPGFATNTQALYQNHKCYNKVSQGRVFPKHDNKVKCGANGAEVDEADIERSSAQFNDAPVKADPNDPDIRKPIAGETEVPEEDGDIPEGTARRVRVMM